MRADRRMAPLLTLMVLACAPSPDSPPPTPTAAPTSPNIVFIMADDLAWGDLSSYGRSDYVTPRIDALATEGVRFTDAYAIAPKCTPTRVGLMTGRYPGRNPYHRRGPGHLNLWRR